MAAFAILLSILLGSPGCAESEDTNPEIPTDVGFDKDDDGVSEVSDCNDADPAIYPGATEICDGIDQDCDQVADNGVTSLSYYDEDGDGYGLADTAYESCEPPMGYAASSGDCDDSDPTIHPGAIDTCDSVDNDCDGILDEDILNLYLDRDGDGHGDPETSAEFCSAEAGAEVGYVATDDDCDDTNATVYEGAEELCDGLDNDCDGDVDEENRSTWYLDGDGDGYGDDEQETAEDCAQPDGHTDQAGDCDDARKSVNPAADEVCNDIDDNCDGEVDEEGAKGSVTFYRDSDGDGFGTSVQTVSSCSSSVPYGYVMNDDDCDDVDPDIYPGAEELCDGLDSNCDGEPGDTETLDTDGDGTVNCLDATPYSIDFDDGMPGWETHNLSGSGDWDTSSGCLHEDDGSASTYAYGPDLGPLTQYTFSADVFMEGDRNDAIGLIFSVTDEHHFNAMVWRDPTDDYGYYDPPGELILYTCSYFCYQVASDDDSQALTLPVEEWKKFKVVVDGDTVKVKSGGEVLFTYTSPGSTFPAYRLGVYSEDNDGGVCFDNFTVTQP